MRRDSDIKDGREYDDEDVGAVRSIFRALSSSVSDSKGKWQVIVLDHADDGIYGEIDGVHEVDNWCNGRCKSLPR